MTVRKVSCKSAASRSGLPGLDWALNPYRGCGHACSYCYAQDVTRFEMGRPWGDIVEVKVNFVQMLKRHLDRHSEGTFGLGTVTDPYQAIERDHELSRGSLKELNRAGSSVSILTKSDLVLRDLDLLAGWKDAEVGVSIGIIDDHLAALLEPGAPQPTRRLAALRRLSSEGIDTYVMAAPIIPGVCDSEESLRRLVDSAENSGVRRIMWDKYNPKPMAGSRLKSALSRQSIELRPGDQAWARVVAERLSRLCRDAEIELVDAF